MLGVITTVESSDVEIRAFEKKTQNKPRGNAKIRAFSLLRTAATSRYLPLSRPTSTHRMFPKHFESTPGSTAGCYAHQPDGFGKDSRNRTEILACRWILLSLQLNKRYQENEPPEKEKHVLEAGRSRLKMTRAETTNPDPSK